MKPYRAETINNKKVPDPAVKDLISKNKEPNTMKKQCLFNGVGKLYIFYQNIRERTANSPLCEDRGNVWLNRGR